MKTKNANPISLLAGRDMQVMNPILLAYLQINHLKQLYRQGWLREGRDVPEEKCESVGDHTFGTIILALLVLAKYAPEVDANKVITMLAIHELGEVYDGDRTPHERIAPDVRHAQEHTSFLKIFERLPEGHIYIQLWEEMESGESEEAKFVKQMDALEMALQAFIYDGQHPGTFDDFFTNVEARLELPYLQELLEEVRGYLQ